VALVFSAWGRGLALTLALANAAAPSIASAADGSNGPGGTNGALAVQASAPSSAALPAAIATALSKARISPDGAYLWVAAVGARQPRLAHQADRLANPASVIKLVTSAVALDVLGPLYTWATPVYADGNVSQGVLRGSLVIQGRGDPRLVTERLWLLLRRVQLLGIREIRGDIVLDRSAFELPDTDPGAFDGERFQPYNAQPDALLVNGKAVFVSFHPEPALGVARIGVEPALAGVDVPASVSLGRGECGDWRAALQPDFSQPDRLRFNGNLPLSCGDKTWAVAYGDPASFNARAIAAMWRELGGKLTGQVREGRVRPGQTPLLELVSPTLPEVVRDMNKHSNNVIAQQIFATLSLAQQGVGRYEASREIVQSRLLERAGCGANELRIDRGSGLSRQERISAACLGRMLQWAWASPWMPELLASLPVAGIETTAKRAISARGRAHLKTGSLNNVAALAGVVDGYDGQRFIVVAIINHPLAGSDDARAALDAVVRWTLDDKDIRP
jgi:D-alanyl-D-alanine carboxypeptidase/D-alanyl-D-alanine-endopeptidase (penicillin-binding protein 4)